jgi:hypothetical protein
MDSEDKDTLEIHRRFDRAREEVSKTVPEEWLDGVEFRLYLFDGPDLQIDSRAEQIILDHAPNAHRWPFLPHHSRLLLDHMSFEELVVRVAQDRQKYTPVEPCLCRVWVDRPMLHIRRKGLVGFYLSTQTEGDNP